jgi:hypothetical protein
LVVVARLRAHRVQNQNLFVQEDCAGCLENTICSNIVRLRHSKIAAGSRCLRGRCLWDFIRCARAYSYLKRLHRWKLVERMLDRRGLLLYRLSRRGSERLAWLRRPAVKRQ